MTTTKLITFEHYLAPTMGADGQVMIDEFIGCFKVVLFPRHVTPPWSTKSPPGRRFRGLRHGHPADGAVPATLGGVEGQVAWAWPGSLPAGDVGMLNSFNYRCKCLVMSVPAITWWGISPCSCLLVVRYVIDYQHL